MSSPARIPVGISACLLGERVRYDGAHKHAAWTDDLADRVAWIPVCPEVGAGFGTPRPPVTLTGDPTAPRMVTVDGSRDVTDALLAFAAAELARLEPADLCGFVLKSKSPSCGLRDIPAGGAGLFARALARKFPDLPVADDVELATAAGRDEFLARVVARARQRGIL